MAPSIRRPRRHRGEGWTIDHIPDVPGRIVVVTGASSGIGLETSRALAHRGAHVVMAVRNLDKGAAAADEIRSENPPGRLTLGHLDLADLSSVRDFVAWLDLQELVTHTLVNNAGIMAVPRSLTVDGFESQLGVNHLGHFALTGLLLDRLLQSPGSRVVTVTSITHRRGSIRFADLMSERSYSRMGAYRQSKLANILFSMELHRRLRRAGRSDPISLAAHPGAARTNLVSGAATGQKMKRALDRVGEISEKVLPSAAEGAVPVLRAATDPQARGGQLYGPAGRSQITGPAVRVDPNPRGLDVHDARALWQRSVELTGVDYAALDW